MERINQIIRHELYQSCLKKNKEYEQERIFCKHSMEHFLDVCRLAEIEWLTYCFVNQEQTMAMAVDKYKNTKKEYEIFREMIYAAGLLHDIGRWKEYEVEIRHEDASALLAPEILRDCQFDEDEIEEILFAILNHRNTEIKEENSLAGILYRADKKSRACFCCDAEKECNWSVSKKNMKIV